jgi:hypothetical protein
MKAYWDQTLIAESDETIPEWIEIERIGELTILPNTEVVVNEGRDLLVTNGI